MIQLPPRFEQQKNEVLQRYRILKGADVHVTSQIAQTAAMAFGVPVVLASLNERYRYWYHAAFGTQAGADTPLALFCAKANLSDASFAFSDVREDEHFALEPAVSGSPGVVFFAAAPLTDPDGKRFGSLCLIDHKPTTFGWDDLALLESFAAIMSQDICVRSAARYAVRDLIEAEHDKAGLFDLAMTDPLTNALNRRAFFRLAEREVLRASRHQKPLSALMIDIDHFKSVNDVHGHASGDDVLSKMVACLMENIRDEDLLGRLGGEEFALVLPETDVEGALILANRLRAQVENLRFSSREGEFSVSVSAGIARPEFVDLDIVPALGRADQALYRAKMNGRNRVEVAVSSAAPRLAAG